ncbi:copper amine oxidase N-terminal domain-containing protein [Paenibacillus sp. OV219]|uniref:copper amine oxidase N-terminal domain-containing protein n=1 Tax=Paenibacillus sp. OV219 TaxID=1884377 RepID=UPI0008BC5812|nr:copper amine oxidase N-terminal domain-containing protein [Paenibacillus sp. OV219]SEO18020.1 Copper amine oxidase N-terminal domain-containing protein [Paenibacillus sp. OV219]
MTARRLSTKWVGLLLLSLVLIITAGCQALGGVDFNAMLKQSLKVTSFESKETIELKLLLKDEALKQLTKEDQELINLISHLTLQLDNVRTSKSGDVSAAGKLLLGDKEIGFNIAIDQKLVALNLEGAKEPIIIHLPEVEEEAVATGPVGAAGAAPENLAETGMKMMDSLSGFTINNLPNPTHLSVDAGQDNVNGESVIGMKIHAELTGKELWDWIKSYIDALLKDQEGLKAMLTGVYEALASQEDALQSMGAESIFGSLPEKEDSADQIKQAVDEITQMLTETSDELKKAEQENKDLIDGIFNDGTYVLGDVFIDSKLDIRKSVIEASIKPNLTELAARPDAAADEEDEDVLAVQDELDEMPFEGVWVKITTERWNVNGDVVPVKPTATAESFDVEQLNKMQGYDVLRQFEPNSVVYGLLHNQLHVSKQAVSLDMKYSNLTPIVTPAGITIVPLRVVAESLGASVMKDASGKLVVVDPATHTTIALKVGSSNAVVNGKTVKWSFPPTIVNGTTYVPARPFVAALHGSLSWEDSYYGDWHTLVISREPV